MVRNQIGVTFKKALSMHKPKGHILEPLLNKHTVKLSCSTMQPMGSKIGAHNNHVERKSEEKPKSRECSFPKTKNKIKYNFPREGKCLEERFVYMCKGVDIISGKTKWDYTGSTKNNMKVRITEH